MKSFVIAQGLAEYGALASKSGGASGSGGLATLRYRLEGYIGQGNAPYFLGGLLLVVLLVFVFRRKWSARG
ncbi:MAG: LPXTG cell wall anchor domain-containing protein [Bacteroidales bacterium]